MLFREIKINIVVLFLGFIFTSSVYSQDQIEWKRINLLSDRGIILNEIEVIKKNIRDLEERLTNDLEKLQLNYEQWVRRNGMDDTSRALLNDINDRKERGELDIKQQKRRLENLYEELKIIDNKLN